MKRFLVIVCSSLFFVAAFFVLFIFPTVSASLSDYLSYLPLVEKYATSVLPTVVPLPTAGPTPTLGPIIPTVPVPIEIIGFSGDVRIVHIHFDGSGSREPDEYVEIKNFEEAISIQLRNWRLSDIANHVFTFPEYVMRPGESCRIYTNEYHPESCGFSYGSGNAIWNNGGDCAHLQDSYGTSESDFCY